MKRLYLLVAFLVILTISSVVPGVSAATSPEMVQSLKEKLESWDVEGLWPEVQEALARQPRDPDLLETASLVAYYRGDYRESLELMKRAIESGGEDEKRRGFARFTEETINVLAPYQTHETPHFIISLDESRDGVLLDYLTDALEKTHQAMARQYGFEPREKVRIELFHDAKAFYLGSALSQRDIEVTGAVGLTKFNKLQFLTPRALVHGYRWLDAISHEYMHYLIFKMSANKAPTWFHEGLAKYEETRWRDGPSYLSPLYRTLLARAQTDDRLIGFADMDPSLVYLDTPQDVQLAYAQAASAIEFIVSSAGGESLRKIMERMARSETEGAGEALREVLGMDLSEFEGKWKEFLASRELEPVSGVKVRRYRIREGTADDERMDLEEIKSLVARNRTHLADRMKERGRTNAAVLEYRRALAENQDSVPVMNRLSSTLIDLDRDEEALTMLKRILELAPDHPTTYTRLGQVYLKLKDFTLARLAFEESVQINPFNPWVHVGLANAYDQLGELERSAKEREITNHLRR
jgi:tetratricopeptide (TPR) repeat protein